MSFFSSVYTTDHILAFHCSTVPPKNCIISFLAMNATSSIFQRLEKFVNSKYPNFHKDILIKCGFDCESALLLLNEVKIKQIEAQVNINKELIKGTIYEKSSKNFEFRLGHKDLILSVPSTIKEIKAKKPKETKFLDVEQLEKDLIKRFNNHFESKSIVVKINHENLIGIRVDENRITCGLKCLFCETNLTCYLNNSSWHISNYVKHIRGGKRPRGGKMKYPPPLYPPSRMYD